MCYSGGFRTQMHLDEAGNVPLFPQAGREAQIGFYPASWKNNNNNNSLKRLQPA